MREGGGKIPTIKQLGTGKNRIKRAIKTKMKVTVLLPIKPKQDKNDFDIKESREKLILDATCAPVDTPYLTDFNY